MQKKENKNGFVNVYSSIAFSCCCLLLLSLVCEINCVDSWTVYCICTVKPLWSENWWDSGQCPLDLRYLPHAVLISYGKLNWVEFNLKAYSSFSCNKIDYLKQALKSDYSFYFNVPYLLLREKMRFRAKEVQFKGKLLIWEPIRLQWSVISKWMNKSKKVKDLKGNWRVAAEC